jgi:sugar/nucleoside kinase (ribokinase family)
MDWDGRRTQVWRSPECDGLYRQLLPAFDQLPAGFRGAGAYHLGLHAAHPPMRLLAQLREEAHARGGLLSAETYTACDAPLLPARREELAGLLALLDVFSPNEGEARSIVGGSYSAASDPAAAAGGEEEGSLGDEAAALALVQQLLDLGVTTVLLRRGADGVLAAHGPSGEAVFVPAWAGTKVRDVVGCGNACCGAFLAAYTRGAGLAASAAWGCAAGSVMAEVEGVPRGAVDDLRRVAAGRQADVLRFARGAKVAGGGASRAAAVRAEARMGLPRRPGARLRGGRAGLAGAGRLAMLGG